jgi:hypothetical protein
MDAMATAGNLDNLTAAQVIILPAATIDSVPTAVIATLTDAQVAALSNEQLAALTSAQMDAMATAGNLDNLTAAQVIILPAATIDSVPTAVITALTDAQVAALSNEQLAALTSAQMEAMATAGNLDNLSDTQISALPITSTLLLNMFTAAGSGTGQAGTAVDAYNYLLNISLQQHDTTSNDGTANQTNSAKILTQYIDQVTGTDIVSAAEKVAGFTITGKATAGANVELWLDNNRRDGVDNAGEVLLTTVTADANGNWSYAFAANSANLLSAEHNVYGSGIHEITAKVGDTSVASRTFLVADGTALTTDTGTVEQNYSVQDAVTGDVFVYYYGDPDGNGVGLWTLQDSGDTATNTSAVTTDRDADGNDWGDWDYYNTTGVSGGTEATAQNTALGFVTDIQAQTWEFHIGKSSTTIVTWSNADASATDHALWNSNTSRMASQDEFYALYAANFGADTGGGGEDAKIVGAIQAISDASNFNGCIAAEDNRPSGWPPCFWSSGPTPSGHGYLYLLFGHSVDNQDGVDNFVAAVL